MYWFVVVRVDVGIRRSSNHNDVGVCILGVGVGTLLIDIVTLGGRACVSGACNCVWCTGGRIEDKFSGNCVRRFRGRMNEKSSGAQLGAWAGVIGCCLCAVIFGLSWLSISASRARAIIISIPNVAKREA